MNRGNLRLLKRGVMAALLCAPAIAFGGNMQGLSPSNNSIAGNVALVSAPGVDRLNRGLRAAVDEFLDGMASGDAQSVWMFASEEDQAAFGTEKAVYDAFADVFPAFVTTESATIERSWQEGDTPFLALALTGEDGNKYRATMGFWLDDAGDWKLVSCDIKAVSDRVAGL